MSDWTWKQAVADQACDIVNQTKTSRFSLNDLYDREDVLQRRFPRNRHVREKIRQTLQRLRDIGLVHFLGGGDYELNFEFEELETEPTARGEEGIQIPRTTQVVRRIRLRNTLLAAHVKQRYECRCQICQVAVQLASRVYAEAHHIRPLGSPHFGRDIEGNILVLCPNHHVMLDRGAVAICADTLTVRHVRDAFEPRTLCLAPWHTLDLPSLSYYRQHIYATESRSPGR
jgi:hypothetical protein